MRTYYFIADAPGRPYGYFLEHEGAPTADSLRDMERGLNCLARAWTFTRELTADEKDKLIYGFTAAEAAEFMKELENDQ